MQTLIRITKWLWQATSLFSHAYWLYAVVAGGGAWVVLEFIMATPLWLSLTVSSLVVIAVSFGILCVLAVKATRKKSSYDINAINKGLGDALDHLAQKDKEGGHGR